MSREKKPIRAVRSRGAACSSHEGIVSRRAPSSPLSSSMARGSGSAGVGFGTAVRRGKTNRADLGRPRFAPLTQPWDTSAYPMVYARDGSRCRYCGSGQDPTVDHVVPRCQGGGDGADNLVVACRPCNLRKSGRTPVQAGMTLLPIGGA